MPVKWSPDLDQLLLLKIIETHDFKLDTKKIVEAWPSNRGETPTPRAISERLVKIKSIAKANTANGDPSTPIKAQISGARSKPSTPKSTPSKKRGAGGKTTKGANGPGEDDDEELNKDDYDVIDANRGKVIKREQDWPDVFGSDGAGERGTNGPMVSTKSPKESQGIKTSPAINTSVKSQAVPTVSFEEEEEEIYV